MLVEMELSRIIISELGDQQVIYLREVNGDRIFPILIGIFEATTIDRRVNQEQAPQRPLTHDLLKNTIETLGGTLQDIVITNLEDHTYYAVLRVDRDGELIEIDSRPSDAIALSIHYNPIVPIFVHESVLEQTSK
ncbi:bifunctional nuclease family protein [uncultured Gimesia sp.]|uniref:bifunctional nuclease family protein n=1 Tax=uncultured Gimesia sp. TaxID=1678688 RepID=UPI0034528C68